MIVVRVKDERLERVIRLYAKMADTDAEDFAMTLIMAGVRKMYADLAPKMPPSFFYEVAEELRRDEEKENENK